MKRTATALLITGATASTTLAMAAGPYGVPVVSAVRSVYDGDTFRVDVAGWPRIIGDDIPIRLSGWDTPELRSRCDTPTLRQQETALARRARRTTYAALRNAETITLHAVDRGSFFRVVADVRLDGVPLAQTLADAGLAIPEQPGSNTWCALIANGELP